MAPDCMLGKRSILDWTLISTASRRFSPAAARGVHGCLPSGVRCRLVSVGPVRRRLAYDVQPRAGVQAIDHRRRRRTTSVMWSINQRSRQLSPSAQKSDLASSKENTKIGLHYVKHMYYNTGKLESHTIFTSLHAMQTRYSDENSVRLSVTRVYCDKTVERSVQIYIPYERTFSLVFWEEEWLVGGDAFYLKF